MPAPLKDDDADEPEFRRLSAAEASSFRASHPQLSPWWVIAGQAGVGILAALCAWVWTASQSAAWSAGYGALAVVVPAALFARGMMGRLASLNAATAAMGFLVWEMVKVALTLAFLFAAPKVVPNLSWLAMLVGMLITMQVYWVAMAFTPRQIKRTNE